MDWRIGGKPQYFSRYGFENAPLSKLIIFASGAATANLLFLPDKHSSLFHLHWPFVVTNKEVWRLVTSQLIYDSASELFYSSVLLYHMRALERQWGTRKFASFIFATCTLTIGSHFLGFYFDFVKKILPMTETMASGLYGPIFGLLFFYAKDVYSGSMLRQNGFSITSKWLTYFIAVRMMLVNKKSYVSAILGLLSGLAWSSNFLYIKKWLCVPNFVSNMAQTVYNWFQIDGDKPCHKKTFCGATEEIHDDMMYDYMTRLQASGRTGSRLQMGQGYADTLQPGPGLMQDLLDDLRMQNRNEQQQQQVGNSGHFGDNGERALQQNAFENNDTSEEEKIQRLVEMGFTRDAVIEALENSGHNIQSATNALLSQ